MIPGKQRAAFHQAIAQVIAGVAGGGHGLDRPVGSADPLTIRQHAVGRIAVIESGIRTRAVIAQAQGRAADDRRAGSRFQRGGGGRMIAVGMGAEDRCDLFACKDADKFADMGGIIAVRAGINHRDLARPHNISLCARIAERRWVVRQHAARWRGSGAL